MKRWIYAATGFVLLALSTGGCNLAMPYGYMYGMMWPWP